MSLQSVADVPLIINSPNSSSERRISPSWTIAHLKSRLEPITGVPASCQQLSLRVASQDAIPVTAADEEQTRLAAFPLQPYAEITVSDSLYSSLLSITSPVLEHYDALVLSKAATSSLLCSSSALPSRYYQFVSSPLVNVLLFILIRCFDRIMRLSAQPALLGAWAPHCPSRPRIYPLIVITQGVSCHAWHTAAVVG
jgi:hypothetical protein